MKTKQSITKFLLIGFLLTILSSFNGCKEDKLSLTPPLSKPSINFVGLTSATVTSPGGQLIRYNSANTNQYTGPVLSIVGLQTGESIIAIDFRPATGQLYGLGSTSRLYVIPIPTSATASSTTAKQVGAGVFAQPIVGTIAGFDFNPTADRIRIVTSTGQNLRLNPEDATVVADMGINGAGAILTGAAYTNNIAGAETTTLYDLDVANQKVYKQAIPNDGVITELGSTGLLPLLNIGPANYSAAYNTNITNFRSAAGGGFDVAPNGIALAVLMNNPAPAIPIGGLSFGSMVNNPTSLVNAVPGVPTLFQINLETGKATDLGLLPLLPPSGGVAATSIIGLAINTDPVAYAIDNTNNELLVFNPLKPVPVSKALTGLQAGETILALDFRPSTGVLYGLGSSNYLYTINTATGATLVVGLLPFSPLLDGAHFGFNFDPKADVTRVVSNTGQHFSVTVGGAGTMAPNLTPDIPTISGAAYNNNTTTPVFYGVDFTTDKLYKIDPATGILTSSGALKINVEEPMGFDIGYTSNTGYGIFTVGTTTKIYTVNLTSGLATVVADFPKSVRGLAVGLGF